MVLPELDPILANKSGNRNLRGSHWDTYSCRSTNKGYRNRQAQSSELLESLAYWACGERRGQRVIPTDLGDKYTDF